MRSVAFVTLLFASLLASPAFAASPPFTISAADGTNPDVQVDADGNAVFKWEQDTGTIFRLQTRRRTAGGVLKGVRNVSWCCADLVDSQLVLQPNGDAVFVYTVVNGDDNFVVRSRTRSADGPFIAGARLGVVDPDSVPFGPTPVVAAGPVGAPVFAWDIGGDIATNAADHPVSGAALAFDPRVGVDPNGNRIFAWIGFDSTALRVQVNAISSTGTRGRTQTLTGTDSDASELQMAVAPNGTAAFVWMDFDGARERVRARTRSAAGVLSDLFLLSNAAQDACDPHVAVDAAGNFVFVWTRFDGTDIRIQTRRLSAAGVLGAVQTVSPAGGSAGEPRVALDADGDAVITWSRDDGTNLRVQARTLSAADVPGAVETLSAAGEDAFAPKVAVAPGGGGVIVWETAAGQIVGQLFP